MDKLFYFAYVWSIGGNLDFNTKARSLLAPAAAGRA
jgi:hypothetical protein